ncbi:hypothetical protein [Streptomyces calidiresistens]|nr:hypothetical protein [Streptomyces calidiresistens]
MATAGSEVARQVGADGLESYGHHRRSSTKVPDRGQEFSNC